MKAYIIKDVLRRGITVADTDREPYMYRLSGDGQLQYNSDEISSTNLSRPRWESGRGWVTFLDSEWGQTLEVAQRKARLVIEDKLDEMEIYSVSDNTIKTIKDFIADEIFSRANILYGADVNICKFAHKGKIYKVDTDADGAKAKFSKDGKTLKSAIALNKKAPVKYPAFWQALKESEWDCDPRWEAKRLI